MFDAKEFGKIHVQAIYTYSEVHVLIAWHACLSWQTTITTNYIFSSIFTF